MLNKGEFWLWRD